MFHWWFLHYKLPTVKYKVVMSICTMETPHTAGLSLTPDHKSVPYLGVAHHGDKEALCHRAQDKDRAAGRLKATKQAGVIGSCNTGQTTSTTCRLASERKQVLINFKPSSGSLEVLPGIQLAAVYCAKLHKQQCNEDRLGSFGGHQPTKVLQVGNTTTLSLDTVHSYSSSYLFMQQCKEDRLGWPSANKSSPGPCPSTCSEHSIKKNKQFLAAFPT